MEVQTQIPDILGGLLTGLMHTASNLRYLEVLSAHNALLRLRDQCQHLEIYFFPAQSLRLSEILDEAVSVYWFAGPLLFPGLTGQFFFEYEVVVCIHRSIAAYYLFGCRVLSFRHPCRLRSKRLSFLRNTTADLQSLLLGQQAVANIAPEYYFLAYFGQYFSFNSCSIHIWYKFIFTLLHLLKISFWYPRSYIFDNSWVDIAERYPALIDDIYEVSFEVELPYFFVDPR